MAEAAKVWTREEIERTLKEILVEALGIEEERIVADASLVHDLGAESIDFLDIGFRIQQTFGVELPNRAIQDKILAWRNMGELGQILEERYHASILAEELKTLRGKGVREVMSWLAERKAVRVENGEAEKVAAEMAERLAREIQSLGFKSTLLDLENISSLLLRDLGSPKITESMLRLFSVGALVDFIAEKVGTNSKVNGQ